MHIQPRLSSGQHCIRRHTGGLFLFSTCSSSSCSVTIASNTLRDSQVRLIFQLGRLGWVRENITMTWTVSDAKFGLLTFSVLARDYPGNPDIPYTDDTLHLSLSTRSHVLDSHTALAAVTPRSHAMRRKTVPFRNPQTLKMSKMIDRLAFLQ